MCSRLESSCLDDLLVLLFTSLAWIFPEESKVGEFLLDEYDQGGNGHGWVFYSMSAIDGMNGL